MEDDEARAFLATNTGPPWSRWQLIAAAAVVIVVAAAVGLWALLAPDERSTETIENGIHSWADENTARGGAIKVECPDPVEWRVGETFNCIVTQGKQSVRVVVTMENDQGATTWVAG